MPSEEKKTSIGDYNKIMSDRNIFNQTVYTLLSEALHLLDKDKYGSPYFISRFFPRKLLPLEVFPKSRIIFFILFFF